MKNPFRKQARLTAAELAARRLADALLDLQTAPVDQRLEGLIRLVGVLRPARPADIDAARVALDCLTLALRSDEPARAAVREGLLWLLAEKQPLRLLSDSGILREEGFWSGLWRRIGHQSLPEEIDRAQLKDIFNLLFYRDSDHLWVEAIPDAQWVALLDALDLPAMPREQGSTAQRMQTQMLEALQVVSYRIAAIGLEPELVRNHPAIERYESPFLMQNVELRDFIDERRHAFAEKRAPTLDDRHLLVLLDQCEEILSKVRRQAAQTGASVSLTHLLLRLQQNIGRLRLLLRLIEDRPEHELNLLRVQLFKALVRAENLRYSVAEFWSQTLELLAQRITGNAGKTGEHYITSSRGEYFLMLRSAMGAGFIVAFMAMLKLWMGSSTHSPLGTALLYSLNYGLGFVLIFMLHFTIATKQPAMTASYLAQALSGNDKGRDRLDDLVELIVRTIRSQLIAIVGNVLPAFTIAALLGTLVLAQTGGHYVSPEKARQLLDEQNPVASLALFHAAIAGVCLFLAGLISGYFDNKAVYDRIPQRLRQLHSLRRRLGKERLERLAQYIENHLGGLAGNFFFGCMLGSMGTLGFILGLPLDIRHITFSTAYFGFAAAALDWQLGARLMAVTALGVLAIGIVNLTVSFGLALYVALRAQRVAFSDTRRLLGKLLRRFLRGPQDFFWPPRDRSVSESAASG